MMYALVYVRVYLVYYMYYKGSLFRVPLQSDSLQSNE